MGAGDLLMGFLGVVIISMGFRIYQQRETMRRHAPEILGATLLSSLFSFFSTALAAKALGLQSGARGGGGGGAWVLATLQGGGGSVLHWHSAPGR